MPPKGKRTAVPQEAFLFVNEDFSTLFRGAKNVQLDRTKQSHVQRQSLAKRCYSKQDETEPTSKANMLSDGGRSPTDSGAGPSTLKPPCGTSAANIHLSFPPSLCLPRSGVRDAHTESSLLTTQPEVETWFSTSRSPLQYPQDTSMAQHMQMVHHPFDTDPRMYSLGPPSTSVPLLGSFDLYQYHEMPSSPVLDPFINFQVALETWAPPLMRYFTTVMISEYFYSDLKAVSLHKMRHVEELHADMRSCMSHPAEMYALLAASAGHSLSILGRIDLPGVTPQDYDRLTLVLASKSFEALRHRLANWELPHSTVMATQRMVCAAIHMSASLAVEAHHRATMSMIEQIGGLETFNDYEKERLIMHNLYYALKTLRAPDFKLTWDPGFFQNNTGFGVFSNMAQKSSCIGNQLRKIVESGAITLHPLLAQIILNLVEVQQVLNWLRTQPYRPADYRWLMQRRLAILHRVLSLRPETRTNHGELVRIALICFMVLSRVMPWSETWLHEHYIAPALRHGRQIHWKRLSRHVLNCYYG